MSNGAQTPEELEMLFEDALMIRDPKAVAELFEKGAVLVIGDEAPARSNVDIVRVALSPWEGDRTYIAAPHYVVQTRELALIVSEDAVNVARRCCDGTWHYAIVFLLVNDRSERENNDKGYESTESDGCCQR